MIEGPCIMLQAANRLYVCEDVRPLLVNSTRLKRIRP